MTNVFIVSAPSGSGKSTLVGRIRETVPNLEFSISYTTRMPRGAEQNACEYYFVSREEFESMIRGDEFLEHADVFGNYYGTARRFLQKAQENGSDLLLDIDVPQQRDQRIGGIIHFHISRALDVIDPPVPRNCKLQRIGNVIVQYHLLIIIYSYV